MRVVEIYKSIQGEGVNAGNLTTFFRTYGCNIRCPWCDTKYSYDGKSYENIVLTEAVARIKELNTQALTLTGGEPLVFPELIELCQSLPSNIQFVDCFTNGTINIKPFRDYVDCFVMDYKLEDLGKDFNIANLELLTSIDVLKFVITDRFMYEKAKGILGCISTKAEVNFTPCYGSHVEQSLAEWIIADNLPVKYALQTHKFIWGEKRGV